MPRLAEAIAADTARKGPECSVAILIAKLSDEDRADLEAALADPEIAAAAIERGLRSLGYNVAAYSLRRHDRGECGCAR